MKATDLMIGDWVKCTDPKCEGHQVDLIDFANEEVGLDGEIDNFENIIPIPLTPEILEKNGWKVTKIQSEPDHYWYDDIPFCIPVNNKWQHSNGYDVTDEKMFCDDFFENTYIRLKFVHELQHAIRLCGIEKEIVL